MEQRKACEWSYIIGTDGALEAERIVVRPGLSTFCRPVLPVGFDPFKMPADPDEGLSIGMETFERLYGRVGAHGPSVFAPAGAGFSIWKSRHMFTIELMRDRVVFAHAFNRWLDRAAPHAAAQSILLCVKAVESVSGFGVDLEAWGVAVPLRGRGAVVSNLSSVVDRALE